MTVAASSFSCTGTLPTGSTKCEGDDTGLTSSIAWQSVGTSASSCTTARKCEYYTSGTSCDLTASLTAVPTTGSAPFKTDLSAFAQTSSVPLHCSSQDCGGGTVSNIINECKFSCTYNNNGTYVPKVHVTNPNCFKDPTASVVVTGGSPACAATTCIGNSCWDGTKYISGTKTQNCATGSAIADPATLIVPNTSYIKWNSNGASKLDFACAGPISTTRGGWYLNDAACKNSGAVKECTDKGYGMAFAANQTGTEICVFYPYNTSDGQIGTPFTVAITSNSGTNTNNGKCGTAAKTYSSTDTNWGNYTFCETGQVNPAAPTFPTVGNSTAWNCKSANGGVDGNCTASRSTNAANSSQTICKPDNANCAKETCNKYYCWDGCAYLKGTGGCN